MINIDKVFQLMENIDSTYIKDTINEITIADKYNKEKDKNNYTSRGIDFDTFEELCKIDPTTNGDNVGKYCNWLIAKYNPGANFEELKRCLEWFADGAKRNILSRYDIPNNINSFKTYEELIETMNSLNNNDDLGISSSEYNNRKKLEGQFEVLGSTSFYDIIAPKTFEAERYFGGNTKWCTVANEDYFSDYMEQGQLYIIYPKNGDSEYKMQFHFESESFADKNDIVNKTGLDCIKRVVKDENICNELISLCKKVFTKNIDYFLSFEEVVELKITKLENGVKPEKLFYYVDYSEEEGFVRVKLRGKYNFINTGNNKILRSDLWFDDAGSFKDGHAKVGIKGMGENYIDTEGEFIPYDKWFDKIFNFKEGLARVWISSEGCNFITSEYKILRPDIWFDKASHFNEGHAKVEINGRGYNFIKTDGEYLRPDLWFDDVFDFNNGFAKVYIKDKGWNFINTKGEILRPDIWFDKVLQFNGGLAYVFIEGRGWNWIKTDREFLRPDIWFDKVWEFKSGCARAYKDGKGWTFIKTDGEYLRDDIWFDSAYDFNNGFAKVYIKDRGWNFIKTNGEYIRNDIWFDEVYDFHYGYASVTIKNTMYHLKSNGILYDFKWKPLQESKKHNNMKRIIKLTESDLHKIIKESVKRVLNEDFGSKVIRNPKLTRLLNREGLGDILLCKDYGYFYIASDNEELANKISTLYSNAIYLNSFNQQSPEEWVEDIKRILRDIE